MFGIGGNELLIIAVFALIIFGPDKIPELARTLGKTWRTFKRAQEDMERVIRAEMLAPDAAERGIGTTAPEPTPAQPASSAASIWSATSEDDDEEEDEE